MVRRIAIHLAYLCVIASVLACQIDRAPQPLVDSKSELIEEILPFDPSEVTASTCTDKCADAFDQFMKDSFETNSSLALKSAKLSTQQILDRCYQVGKMDYDESFNCRDFTKWFLLCLERKGVESSALDMFCKDCADGESHGHRVAIYKKGSMWCPGEPQRESKGESTGCCSFSKAKAKKCALSRYCSGFFPERTSARKSFSCCKPKRMVERTCTECARETCSRDEKRRVCELLEMDEDESDECWDELKSCYERTKRSGDGDCDWCCSNSTSTKKACNIDGHPCRSFCEALEGSDGSLNALLEENSSASRSTYSPTIRSRPTKRPWLPTCPVPQETWDAPFFGVATTDSGPQRLSLWTGTKQMLRPEQDAQIKTKTRTACDETFALLEGFKSRVKPFVEDLCKKVKGEVVDLNENAWTFLSTKSECYDTWEGVPHNTVVNLVSGIHCKAAVEHSHQSLQRFAHKKACETLFPVGDYEPAAEFPGLTNFGAQPIRVWGKGETPQEAKADAMKKMRSSIAWTNKRDYEYEKRTVSYAKLGTFSIGPFQTSGVLPDGSSKDEYTFTSIFLRVACAKVRTPSTCE